MSQTETRNCDELVARLVELADTRESWSLGHATDEDLCDALDDSMPAIRAFLAGLSDTRRRET